MNFMRELAAAAFGATLILISLQEAFVVVLLPRPVRHRRLVVPYFFGVTWAVWSRIGSKFPPNMRREGFLGIYGPLAMVLLFSSWAVSLIIGFGCLQWALQTGDPHHHSALATDLLISGDVFFTLGYENLVPHSILYRLLTILEAGTGFAFIALSVSYLPVLYLHFSERDRQLIQLGSRAGSPPAAETLLLRFAKESNIEKLNDWLRDWETWAAELIESHSSYPMLAFYRSQHENHSWLASLAVILDSCTLLITGGEESASLQAESTFAATRRVLVEISRALGTSAKADVGRFQIDVLVRLEHDLESLNLRWSDKRSSEDTILDLQSCYEPMLKGLSSYLLLPLPKWTCEVAPNDHSGINPVAWRLIQTGRPSPASLLHSNQRPRS